MRTAQGEAVGTKIQHPLTSAIGYKRKLRAPEIMSALTPTADIAVIAPGAKFMAMVIELHRRWSCLANAVLRIWVMNRPSPHACGASEMRRLADIEPRTSAMRR